MGVLICAAALVAISATAATLRCLTIVTRVWRQVMVRPLVWLVMIALEGHRDAHRLRRPTVWIPDTREREGVRPARDTIDHHRSVQIPGEIAAVAKRRR